MPSRFIKCSLLCSFFLVIASCGGTQFKPSGTQPDAAPSLDQIPQMLQEAETLEGPKRDAVKIQAASLLLTYGDTDWARSVAAEVQAEELDAANYIDYILVVSGVAARSGEPFVAKRVLSDPKVEQKLRMVGAEKRIGLYDHRAKLYHNIAEYRQAIEQRLAIDKITNDPDFKDLNQDLIWQSLMALSEADLKLESKMQRDPVAKGWYQLAAVSKNYQTDMQRQLQQVKAWAQQKPQHPASIRLPADLQLLRQLVEKQPRQVALLLPLSGKVKKAAEAIRDGFMAAYFEARNNASRPDIRVYDTTGEDISDIYNSAVFNGAELIIGPLNKDNIETLAAQTELPIPTLALNYIDIQEMTEQLYQFGLAVEDEAIQVAERAWQDGLRRAMVVARKGKWGDRSALTFMQHWQQLGGEIIGEYRFQDTKDYSNLIREAMQISQSTQRKSDLQRRLGTRLEFEPRRRKDIDLIFLVAYPTQARQIKPTLAFHYAGDIPVYATSHIFNGRNDSSADRDMNDIRFTTMPWFFNQDFSEKQAIEKYASPNPAYQQLYAFGVDVFHLYPRLRQLEEVEQARFYGTTGTLSLNLDRRVVRQQAWAQFVNGQAQAMPSTANNNNPAEQQ